MIACITLWQDLKRNWRNFFGVILWFGPGIRFDRDGKHQIISKHHFTANKIDFTRIFEIALTTDSYVYVPNRYGVASYSRRIQKTPYLETISSQELDSPNWRSIFFSLQDDHRQSGQQSGSISFSRTAEADQAHAGAKLSLDKEPNHQRVSTQIATKQNHWNDQTYWKAARNHLKTWRLSATKPNIFFARKKSLEWKIGGS